MAHLYIVPMCEFLLFAKKKDKTKIKGVENIMSIYHWSCQIISRSKGRSVTSSAAYRSGTKIFDERLNTTFNYEKKQVADSFILTPKNVPEFVYDRSKLWNEIERIEKRKDSQLSREINISFPVELTEEQQTELITTYVQKNFVNKGMISDVCIHRDNPNNPHCHVMLTMREINSEGFGKKNREWNDKSLVEEWRKEWSNECNKYLEISKQIDHRSYKRQGINKVPQIHENIHVRGLEKKGVKTKIRQYNESVIVHNKILELEEILKDTIRQKSYNNQTRRSLRDERDNIRFEGWEINSKLRMIDNHFNKIERLTNRQTELHQKMNSIQSEKPHKRFLKQKQYKNTLQSLKNEIKVNTEELNVLNKKSSDLKKQKRDLTSEKDKLLEQGKVIQKEIVTELYKPQKQRSKQKNRELE